MSAVPKCVRYRKATPYDVPSMVHARARDPTAGPADPRMARYLEGKHHPHQALEPRVMFVGMVGNAVVGYIGGHLTRRYDCHGELQYLYVVPRHRRSGVASELLVRLAEWFAEREALRVCVDVEPSNETARAFYVRHGAAELSEYWMVWTDITSVLGRR